MNHNLVFIGTEEDDGNIRMRYTCQNPECDLAASYYIERREVNNRLIQKEVLRKMASVILLDDRFRWCPFCGDNPK